MQTQNVPCSDVVPCAHIADYYDHAWHEARNIGNNLLRHGYRQWAEGRVIDRRANNLFGADA